MTWLPSRKQQPTEKPNTPDFSMNRQFLHSTAKRPRLRVAIACDNQLIPRFARQILRDISGSNFASIVCIIDNRKTGAHGGKRLWSLASNLIDSSKRRCLLYRCYQILVTPFQRHSIDPLAMAPFSDLIPTKNITHLEFNATRETTAPPTPNLDIVLNLGSLLLNKGCSEIAHYGVWFFRLGEGKAQTNDPELIANVLADPASTARITLEMAKHSDHTASLAEAFFSMAPTLSARKNHFSPYWGSTHFVIEKLYELHQSGRIDPVVEQQPGPEKHKKRLRPTNRQILACQRDRLQKFAHRLPGALQEGPNYVHWDIALRHSPTPLLEQEEGAALSQFHWLQSPPGHFWADPFLIEHNGATWLYFEDFVLADGKGRIACGWVSKEGDLRDVRVVLEKPYHLSYPQIFHYKGEVFLVPESEQHNCLNLYRATDFPNEWACERQLLDVSVVDATLAKHNGCWWIFASPMAVSGHAPMTYLWIADDLTGDWRLASPNPISSNVCHSRGAGSLYAQNGKLYRVSQDGSTAYGSALWFNEIKRWDSNSYEEEPVRCIKGENIPGLTGIHSYNRAGCWEVIDGRFLRSKRCCQHTGASYVITPSSDSPPPPSTHP